MFSVLMSDLNLHTKDSKLTNFADDTQIHICEENEESLRKVTKQEAESVITFFEGVKLSNNPDKAALIYNSKGKGMSTEMEIGGKILKSSNDEKLLGLQVSSDLNWNTHVDKLCVTLKQRMSLLKRIKRKVNNEKMEMIADAIFQSKLRYGIAAYGCPKFKFNHLEQTMDPNLGKLQVVQNDMLRILNGKTRSDHTNMQKLREEIKMMSVNQLSIYHVAIEMFNIINNASSEPLQRKMKIEQRGYQLRSLEDGKVKVPEKGKKSCQGFGYIGPKLWNYLPGHIRKTTISEIFKDKLKDWIWEFTPSV